MKRILLKLVVLSVVVFITFYLGFRTGVVKAFPYDQMRYLIGLKNKLLKNDSDVKSNYDKKSIQFRDTVITNRVVVKYDSNLNTGVFLTYGQSNSVNSGQYGYSVKSKVYQHFNKILYLYEDPSLGGDGGNGSVWGMVGDKLISEGLYEQVIFAVTGLGSKSIEELNGGEYYDYFKKEYRELILKFGRVNGILFHQGESNHHALKGSINYKNDFLLFLERMRKDGIKSPIYLSQTTYCGSRQVDEGLHNIQNELIIDEKVVLRGPDTDLLTNKEFRLPDGCHFSMLGFEKYSDMWVNCIKKYSEN